jgi:hypothetical protein
MEILPSSRSLGRNTDSWVQFRASYSSVLLGYVFSAYSMLDSVDTVTVSRLINPSKRSSADTFGNLMMNEEGKLTLAADPSVLVPSPTMLYVSAYGSISLLDVEPGMTITEIVSTPT